MNLLLVYHKTFIPSTCAASSYLYVASEAPPCSIPRAGNKKPGPNPKIGTRLHDPCGNRTHVNGVRGRCLNLLTNGPYKKERAGIYLFSQAVASQLSSARVSLTSVFGMGTGGTSPSSTPAASLFQGYTLKTEYELLWQIEYQKDGVKPSTY